MSSDSDSDSDWVVDTNPEPQPDSPKHNTLPPSPLEKSTAKDKDLSFLTPDAPPSSKLDESDWLEEKSEKEPAVKQPSDAKPDFSDPTPHNTSLIQGTLDIGK